MNASAIEVNGWSVGEIAATASMENTAEGHEHTIGMMTTTVIVIIEARALLFLFGSM